MACNFCAPDGEIVWVWGSAWWISGSKIHCSDDGFDSGLEIRVCPMCGGRLRLVENGGDSMTERSDTDIIRYIRHLHGLCDTVLDAWDAGLSIDEIIGEIDKIPVCKIPLRWE